MQLRFIDNVSVSQVKDLRFNCTIRGKSPGDITSGAVTTVTPDSTGKIKADNPDTAAVWGILSEYFPDVFIENQHKLAYVFASINLAPTASASWLSPKKFVYQYLSPTTGNDGFLAILSLTEDRSVEAISVDSTLLDSKHQFFILISEALFLKNIILPQLSQIYGHHSTFEYKPFSPTAGKIVASAPFQIDSVQVGLIYYDPQITSFSTTIQDDMLITEINVFCWIKGLANASISVSLKTENKFQYDSNNNAITFLPDPNPNTSSSKYIPWYDYLGGIVALPIILAITSSIEDSVSKITKSYGERMAVMFSSAVVDWSNVSHANVNECGLEQSLFIRGNY